MQTLWEKLKSANRPVFLYGMGNGADKILDECIRLGIEISGVFASDGFVRGQSFRGFTVESYSEAKEKHPDMIALLCFGSSLPEVIDSVTQKSAEVTLFAPSVPVYGENIFNESFYRENKEKIDLARSVFSDERSKEVFDSIINYRLSGEIGYLLQAQNTREENYSLLGLENEIFVDLGAYRGDTLLEISELCNLKKAFVCEPDIKSFKKLKENTKHIKNVEYINCAIGEKDGEAYFDRKKGRGSSVAMTGETVELRAVDSVLKGERATFIKMDVEGNEKNALIGAKNTIREYLPKLKIAAYHRSEDIFDLPLLIHNFSEEYQLFLRHEPSLPDWDTDIFAVKK